MFAVVSAMCWILELQFKSRSEIEAENLALRQQLNVMSRRAPRRLQLQNSDRLLFVWFYRLWPSVLGSMVIVRPDTVVRWHRHGFKAFWRCKTQGCPGRPRIPRDVRGLIREASVAKPLWGAPRIHGELLKLGIDVAQSTVAKYMVKGRRPPSQTWKTFLPNHAEGIASVDFLIVPTAAFKLLFGLIILRHDRRRLVHVAVTAHPTADWIARQITEAFPWERMAMRRFTRLTNAVSKKFENHVHMVALFTVWYNFVKQHKSLKGLTPAMAAGVTEKLWSMADIVALIDAAAPKPGSRGPYKKRNSN